MLPLALMITASSIASSPVLLPGSGFTAGNPPSIEQSARTGFIGIHVTVDDKGLPHDCVILFSSSNQGLDTKICEIALTKMHFTPAHDPAGRYPSGGSRFAGSGLRIEDVLTAARKDVRFDDGAGDDTVGTGASPSLER